MALRMCRKCKKLFPEEWFISTNTHKEITNTSICKSYKLAVCPMCRQTERDNHKKEDRTVSKARRMRDSHARKFGVKPRILTDEYGWDVERMAHDIKHAYENGCFYCGHPYKEMGNGLRDLTLDIINPNDKPYYTNVRYCCATCNSVKGQRGSDLFGLHLVCVKKWLSDDICITNPQYRMDLN